MAMALATGTWTVAERDRLPDDGNRNEVVDGELFVTPMPLPRHQAILKQLFVRLHEYVTRYAIGSTYPSAADVILGGRDVVVPDVVVFRYRPGHDDVRVADVLTWHPDGAPVALEIPLAEIFE